MGKGNHGSTVPVRHLETIIFIQQDHSVSSLYKVFLNSQLIVACLDLCHWESKAHVHNDVLVNMCSTKLALTDSVSECFDAEPENVLSVYLPC